MRGRIASPRIASPGRKLAIQDNYMAIGVIQSSDVSIRTRNDLAHSGFGSSASQPVVSLASCGSSVARACWREGGGMSQAGGEGETGLAGASG